MIKVVRKPPQLDAVQFKGDNMPELERFLGLSHVVLNALSIEIGDWIVMDDEGDFDVISDKEFDRLYERV